MEEGRENVNPLQTFESNLSVFRCIGPTLSLILLIPPFQLLQMAPLGRLDALFLLPL